MTLNRRQVQHLYLRAGFGALPDELRRWEGKSREEVVDHLFASSGNFRQLDLIPDPLKGKAEVSNFQVLAMILRSGPEMQNLNFAWLYQMAESPAMVREKACLFWHGHFATSAPFSYLMQGQNNLLRRLAFSSFREILHAIARDPAMIIYLNNQENHKDLPNENFAREVLELFTLGIGHYSESDIRAAARAFTGWSVNRKGVFEFKAGDHDEGEKTFLGRTGPFNGDDILDIILEQPQVSLFLANKLLRYYYHPEPNPEKVRELAEEMSRNGMNTEKSLRYLFTRDWFYDDDCIGAIIVAPVPLLARLIRYFGVEFEKGETLLHLQQTMGQTLFFPPNVAGWKGHRAWLDSASLLLRLSLPGLFLKSVPFRMKGKPEFEETSQKKLQDQSSGAITARFSRMETAYAAVAGPELPATLLNDFITVDTSQITFPESASVDNLREACIAVCSLPEFQLT
jgi:uncharacterized protein (DUF1800 family)